MIGLLGLGLSAIGGFMQFGAAQKQAKANAMSAILELKGQYEQVAIQNEQLLQEVDLIKLSGQNQIQERLQQLQKVKVNNALFVSGSGLSANFSEGVAARVSERKAENDIQLIEFDGVSKRRNISQQIKVNRMSLEYGGYRAATNISNGYRQAAGVGMQAALSFGQSLLNYGVPGMRT